MRITEPLFVGVYWFSGGYIMASWTPYALQAGLLGLFIGELLLAWAMLIEDFGGKIDPLLGCALLGTPWLMILVGVTYWGMRFIGLL